MSSRSLAPVRIVEHEKPSPEVLQHLVSWLSSSSTGKATGEHFCKVKYEDDRAFHELFWTAFLKRRSHHSTLLTTEDLNGMRFEIEPGVAVDMNDLDWRSGDDAEWDAYRERVGMEHARACFTARSGPSADPDDLVAKKVRESVCDLYENADAGLKHYRTMSLIVHEGCQGKGYGAALHRHTADKARQKGCKVWFLCDQKTVPYFEGLECESIKSFKEKSGAITHVMQDG